MINALPISLSGLNAASRQAQAAASNIANAGTSGAISEENGPPAYQAQDVLLSSTVISSSGSGVNASLVPRDPSTLVAFDPDSPFADSEGLVSVPNVDVAEELVNLKLAELSYKANISVIETQNDLSEELLDILS